MNRTQIEWVRNPDGSPGYTFNPITGCLNNCSYCYARKLANGRLKSRYLANGNTAPQYAGMRLITLGDHIDPFYPRLWRNRFQDFGTPDSYGSQTILKPKGIFVCDMSDLFGIGIPEDWTRLVLEYIKDYPEHRFYLLTKQPQNLIKFSPFPDNCKVGITVTHKANLLPALEGLTAIDCSIRFLSFEPLLDNFTDYYSQGASLDFCLAVADINQIIIGAQTKPYRPPAIEAVEEIVRAADKAGIPVFLKNNLAPLLRQTDMSKPFWSNPRWMLLRQEIPR